MDSVDDILLDAEAEMEKSLSFMQEQMLGIRTGKADPALVENIKAEYYGTPTRLKEIAGISTPEPRLIVINAFVCKNHLDGPHIGGSVKAIKDRGVTHMIASQLSG